MGRKKSPTSEMDVAEKQSTPLAQRLSELITDNIALKEYLGVSLQAVNQYRLGIARPTLENLCKIANFYGVTTDYLLNRTETKTINEDVATAIKATGLSEGAVLKLNRLYYDTDGRIPGVVAMRRRFVDLISTLIESDNCEKIFDGIAEYICNASALRVEEDNDLWVEPDEYERVRHYIEASGKVIAFRADVCETSMQTALRLFRETFTALAEKEKAQREDGNNGKH